MKLHKLRLANLNSLQGTWEIDFSAPSLQSEGIFLISGPTGSGKSTILDAICLALYGATPRLGKITDSGNEIMSRGSTECFAQLSFSAGAGMYVARWQQKRARRKADGKLQPIMRELSQGNEENGKILASTIKEIDSQIAEIMGLNFAQFTRSILLAQGDFAAFLESEPNARGNILEKITGTGIYRQVSICCFERHKRERMNLELLQKEQELRLPLAAAQRDLLEAQLKATQNQLSQADTDFLQLEEGRNLVQGFVQMWQENITLQEAGSNLQRGEQDKLRLAQGILAQDLSPLRQSARASIQHEQEKSAEIAEKHRSSILLQNRLAESEQGLAAITERFELERQFLQDFSLRREGLQQLEWRSEEGRKKLVQLSGEQEDCRNREAEAAENLLEQQQQRDEIQEGIASREKELPSYFPALLKEFEVRDWESRLLQLQELGTWLDKAEEPKIWEQQYYTLQGQLQQTRAKLELEKGRSYQEELAAVQQQLAEVVELPALELPAFPEILQRAEGANELPLEEREEVLNRAQECCYRLISPLELYLSKREQYWSAREERTLSRKIQEEQATQLARVEMDLAKLEGKFKKQEFYCKTLVQNQEWHKHWLFLAEERAKLQDGEACPLCGSRSHAPEELTPPSYDILAVELELEKQEKELRELGNAVRGDREEAEKLRLEQENSCRQEQKQASHASRLHGELQEQSKLLCQVFQDYRQVACAPQALLPLLWDELDVSPLGSTEQDGVVTPAAALRQELALCREQLEAYRSAEDQACEEHRLLCEQLEQERAQLRKQQQEQLQQLQMEQGQAGLRMENLRAELARDESRLEEFYQRFRQDLLRIFDPYLQWCNFLEKNTSLPLEKIEGQLQELGKIGIGEGSGRNGEQQQSLEYDELLDTALPLLFRPELAACVELRRNNLQDTIHTWQDLQDLHGQVPLVTERCRVAEEKKEAEGGQLQELEQLQQQAEAVRQELQDSWERELAELEQQSPYPRVLPELSPQGLGTLVAGLAEYFESTRRKQELCQKNVVELRTLYEVEQQLHIHLEKELLRLQEQRQQQQQAWEHALHGSNFVDEDAFLRAELPEPERKKLEGQVRDWEDELAQLHRQWGDNILQLQEGMIALRSWQNPNTAGIPAGLTPILSGCEPLLAKFTELSFSEIVGEANTPRSPLGRIQQLLQQQQDLCRQLERQLQQSKEQIATIREGLGAQKKDLADDDILRSRQEEGAAQVCLQQEQVEYWSVLNELIGAANGNKFSNFAQQLSFEQLLHYANLYLERISERYLLQGVRERPLEFFVLDLYQEQGQNVRPSSNLSGGEKFLVSLALALALSRISANKVPVQSLFLDEGFGTLDEETLHSTLEVLGSLRSDGKLIGLISHIPALKERIMCQIQLESLGEGRSRIICPDDLGTTNSLGPIASNILKEREGGSTENTAGEAEHTRQAKQKLPEKPPQGELF